jgi:hypothetical protein
MLTTGLFCMVAMFAPQEALNAVLALFTTYVLTKIKQHDFFK